MTKNRGVELPLAEKANRILNGILIVISIILFKIWYLAVVQHEDKLQESKRPQQRAVLESSIRAPIYDRDGLLLATNEIQYNVTITYGPIQQIPRAIWERDENGKKRRSFPRRDYITKFSHYLADLLHLDPTYIEDFIHSKAALLGNVPVVLFENISEENYFELKMKEKDFPGLSIEVASRRHYPMGKIGAQIVGYVGPISSEEYQSYTNEIKDLRALLIEHEEGIDVEIPKGFVSLEHVKERLDSLEKAAIGLNDFKGKMGVEASFDQQLRGQRGKRLFLADRKGNYLKELPGSRRATSGMPLYLSLSSELQEYAEQLLVEYEQEPYTYSPKRLKNLPKNQPWIKGGAIVVMEPNTGEILALASSPRFDPNDFVKSTDPCSSVDTMARFQWLESRLYLENVWDHKTCLSKEVFYPLSGTFEEKKVPLTWQTYLDFILPDQSLLRQKLGEIQTLGEALKLQKLAASLFRFFQSDNHVLKPSVVLDLLYTGSTHLAVNHLISIPDRDFFAQIMSENAYSVLSVKELLDPYLISLKYNKEKLLLIDLTRLVFNEQNSAALIFSNWRDLSLGEVRDLSALLGPVEDQVKAISRELFKDSTFSAWREEHFKHFLDEKRAEEKRKNRRWAKPYIDYLNEALETQFSLFWNERKWELIYCFLGGESFLDDEYIQMLQLWACDLASGAYPAWDWTESYHQLVRKVQGISKEAFFALFSSLPRFKDLTDCLYGSYPGLVPNHRAGTLQDLACAFYPRYGYGNARSHAFRQATVIGSIFKLIPAYEAGRQMYMSALERGEKNPHVSFFTMTDDKHKQKDGWYVGYWDNGKPIPIFYKGGRLPRTEHAGVGKIDLPRALETSSNPYFALLASDVMEDPEDLVRAANLLGYGEKTGISIPGEFAGKLPQDVVFNRSGLYALSMGQHSLVGTPLQTAVMLSAFANGGDVLRPIISMQETKNVRWSIFLPNVLRHELMQGMHQVIHGEKGTARGLKKEFSKEFLKRVVGKTSTAEVMERLSLDAENGVMKDKVIWFGAILFSEKGANLYQDPELVVVVYLRHGMWGRLAAPYALKMMQKWEEYKKKHK